MEHPKNKTAMHVCGGCVFRLTCLAEAYVHIAVIKELLLSQPFQQSHRQTTSRADWFRKLACDLVLVSVH